jgi:hypothetical protein
MNLKPFDLEKALAGAPVVTRDGLKVHDIYFSMRLGGMDESFPVIGVVDGDKSVLTWTKEGFFMIGAGDSDNDLFMAAEVMYAALLIVNGVYSLAQGRNLYKTPEEVEAEWADENHFVRAVEVHL